MREKITSAFIRKIPKSDLHVHLDGSLRLGTLIELARQEGVRLPSFTKDGLKELVFKPSYADLPEYLKGFAYTCAVLQTPENLERVSREFLEDNLEEGVRYVEVRFAPQLHTSKAMSMRETIQAVIRGLESAARSHNRSPEVRAGHDLPVHYGVIVCAMRRFNRHMSPYFADFLRIMSHSKRKRIYAAASLELARAAVWLVETENLPVVGFDLAGEEAGFPAIDHADAYQYVHSHFIRKTVHAGEAYGPESIFQALTKCYANRIGHGTFLFAVDMIRDPRIRNRERYVANLANYIASQRIGIEVCVTSNLQTTPSITRVEDHPIKKMLEWGLPATACTDNRLVSDTTVSQELEMIAKHARLSRRQLRDLVVAGFKGSFFPGSSNEKKVFVKRVINRFEELIESELPPLR